MISLVLGLGNIGREYENTRHNVGFEVVKELCRRWNLSLKTGSHLYDWAEKERDGKRIILALPKTYMNRSGLAARALLQENNLEPSQMLVVVDDFNLPLGRLRIRPSGSDGGHNGLASLIEELETESFPRLRLGIGPLPEDTNSVDFVLSSFHNEEREVVKQMIETAAEAVEYAIGHRLEEAMTKYNVNPAQSAC